MSTRDVRQLVARFDAVSCVVVSVVEVDVFVDPLAILERGARGRDVEPAGEVRVYRAVVVVVGGAGQRVLVEAFLCGHVARVDVGPVADGELDVSLGTRFVRGAGGVSLSLST